jgi:hypothetical protein
VTETPVQGTLKSTAFQTLCPCPDWFTDGLPLGVDSKEVIERTAGRWIVGAGEMHGNRGREAEQLKAMLSRQVDGPVRLAYSLIPVSVPRLSPCAGRACSAASASRMVRTLHSCRPRVGPFVACGREQERATASAACS